MKITGATRVTGIFGHPVAHTLSPSMHNAAFEALGLDLVYVPFDVAPQDLRAAVESVRVLGLAGVNVTIPHKTAVMKYLDRIDPLAEKIGSVNTIVNKSGVLTGYNTDATGFLKDITLKGTSPKTKTVLLLGAGGAGRALAAALSWAGANKIYIADRDEKRARQLARVFPKAAFLKLTEIPRCAGQQDIVINATGLGMHKGDPSPVDLAQFKDDIFAYDLVYHRRTKFLAQAAKLSINSSNGLGMLLHQGALAFEHWTGKKAPLAVMQKTLLKQLRKG